MQNAQFVIISLRNNMFELADRLIGIYKTSDQTRSITIDPRKFVMPALQQARSATAPQMSLKGAREAHSDAADAEVAVV